MRPDTENNTTPPPPAVSDHITVTPGVCGGKPCIAGSRIRVQDIVVWHEADRMTPEEIIVHYPSITLADIYAALAYYHDHREDIRHQMAEDAAFTDSFRKTLPSSHLNC